MQQYNGFIFDLDGTIYLGQQAIDGAVDTVNKLIEDGKKTVFLTNKTIESRSYIMKKLNNLGIQAVPEQMISPLVTTLKMLREQFYGKKVYVIGEAVIKKELEQEGIPFAASPDETDVVILSWDRDFHYQHIEFAYRAVMNGAVVMATNPDRTCPMPGGDMPDCGSIIGALEGATGKKIDMVLGKPSEHMIGTALAVLGLEAAECLMIGDRLETDIYMGNQSNIDTALVLSGTATEEEAAASPHKPTYIIGSVKDLI